MKHVCGDFLQCNVGSDVSYVGFQIIHIAWMIAVGIVFNVAL